ncbi:MAG: M23 family metallopeptidase [Bacteriovoracaceae bacterium]
MIQKNRYYTLMMVPEKEHSIRSIRIPHLMFKSLAVMLALLTLLIGIMVYDYWHVMQQIYENKHLKIENKELKEQLQIFQMKLNSLTEDLSRIYIFEKKLRVITGTENIDLIKNSPFYQKQQIIPLEDNNQSFLYPGNKTEDWKESEGLKKVQKLYEVKLSEKFGINSNLNFPKEWFDLSRKSVQLATKFAEFDYLFQETHKVINELELKIQSLDQYALDNESFIKSTPTLIPTKGWITSYFATRISPYSGRLKMHEGIDIGAPDGTDIIAPADGVVTIAKDKPGFGRFVQIDHGYGIETLFGHASVLLVHSGQQVKRGDLIARVGNTGLSTGPHLHYEVRVNGVAIDPLYFVLD